MKTKRATQILTSLVQGLDPVSGAELPADGVLQRADVLRALLAAIAALETGAAREARRAQLPANVGSAWTAEEEQGLVKAFQAGDALADIAEKLGRTVRAVEARLERLGLLTAEQRSTRDSFTG
jgi:DNA-binding NarL/FixJ family response regulator